jgi:hypothetical protein
MTAAPLVLQSIPNNSSTEPTKNLVPASIPTSTVNSQPNNSINKTEILYLQKEAESDPVLKSKIVAILSKEMTEEQKINELRDLASSYKMATMSR